MKYRLSKLFSTLSVVLLLGAVILTFSVRNTPPILVGSLHKADLQSEHFMEVLCSGDYTAAEKLLAGSPDLTPDKAYASPLTQALWEAYIHSFSYEFQDSCYSDAFGLYRNVTVTTLDLPLFMADLQTRFPIHSGTQDHDQIMNTLAEAVPNLIARGEYSTTHHLTLQLTARNGQWKILPTPQLINLLQGNVGGT